MMNNFYVYIHRREDTGDVFYVGKGKGYRAYVTKGRNDLWTKIFKKAGRSVEIVADKLTEADSFELEILLVQEYGLANLANMTEGGEGTSGVARSQEFRDNLSKYYTGRKKSKEHLKNISKALTGRTLPEETVEKMRISRTGKKHSKDTIEKIRKGNQNKKVSEETKKKLRKPKPKGFGEKIRKRNLERGKIGPLPKKKCPHCGKEMAINNIYKYHFENCDTPS